MCWNAMLTVINIKRSHFCLLHYLASSASPSIKSSDALACWGFPNPFSHFVWLRVFAKRYFSSTSSSRKQKDPEPGTTESDVWLRMFFYLFLCAAWTTETIFEIFQKNFCEIFDLCSLWLARFPTHSYTRKPQKCMQSVSSQNKNHLL